MMNKGFIVHRSVIHKLALAHKKQVNRIKMKMAKFLLLCPPYSPMFSNADVLHLLSQHNLIQETAPAEGRALR